MKAKEAREAEEAKKPNASGMLYMIELFSHNSESSTWLLDIVCGTHLCNNVQGLQNNRRLRNGKWTCVWGMEQSLLRCA